MDNFKITKTILENINEQNDRINECVDIVNGYTTDEETRVNQELQRQENELRREEQYNNNENRFTVINEQLETMTNTKIDYPILQCEIGKVVNVKYEYGNILRYGAVSGSNSTNAFQVAFDVCKDSGHSVKIPNVGQYILSSPIILYPNVKYKMIQDNNIGFTNQPKNDYRIKCKSDMFNTIDGNTDISIDIDGVSVVFFKEGITNGYINDLGVFYHLRVIQSVINNFTVECPGYFFKSAGCNVGTIIQNSYIHNVSKAFANANSNYLIADSIVKNCRISGRASENPTFLNGSVDVDMRFSGNFIDYFAYFCSGDSTSTIYVCGKVENNIFNRMFRMIKNGGKGVFKNNIFEYFKSTEAAFTNKTDLMLNGKWGAFVFDKNNENRGYQDIYLIDNIINDCDYYLYYLPNNTSNNAYGTNIIESGTLGKANNETFVFNPRTSSSKSGFLTSKVKSLDYEDRSAETVPSSVSKQESYEGKSYNVYDTWCGCHRFYNDGLYIACPDLTWKKLS